jgi:hypothetical protein
VSRKYEASLCIVILIIFKGTVSSTVCVVWLAVWLAKCIHTNVLIQLSSVHIEISSCNDPSFHQFRVVPCIQSWSLWNKDVNLCVERVYLMILKITNCWINSIPLWTLGVSCCLAFLGNITHKKDNTSWMWIGNVSGYHCSSNVCVRQGNKLGSCTWDYILWKLESKIQMIIKF